jgi:2-polyprenyl-3-methyl-5-hydroxy-6-metoxy-1,4-benzoquinol methylase
MKPDFPQCLIRDFPEEFELARAACATIIACSQGKDFTPLTRHSPGLKGFDWANYLELSSIRMVRALRMLQQRCAPGTQVLDLGAYFGNFSLMLARAGFLVTAVDAYEQYGDCLRAQTDTLRQHGVRIMSFEEFDQLPAHVFDAALLMGVIEHVPHTPRLLLERTHQLLRPSGLLVLDTPNLGYIYNRQKLARGESIFPPIQSQYWTDLPFEGHHREFTMQEVLWMLRAADFHVRESDLFNYSLFGLRELTGIDLDNYISMEKDPNLRELQIHAAFSIC